ncbi:hypothetical protein [Rhizobium laguerreae]|uniref:hypothetical protein n=1 Tax=Rhizobium laguerreae TaxID=1076926 RepID=UPI001C923379|nr:hypothetical protein [Rhizobium laguerreae]MBY3198224.1 hypothetical protein [Rhizobium laguerreae]
MGAVVYGGHWTPVLIGDDGPFMLLGEGSSRVFEAIGQSHCKKWSSDTGDWAYPYKNFGLARELQYFIISSAYMVLHSETTGAPASCSKPLARMESCVARSTVPSMQRWLADKL